MGKDLDHEVCCETCRLFGDPAVEVPAPPPVSAPRTSTFTNTRFLVTEKGGTTREVIPDGPEINVGRVQGNHIVLPRGNVSKRTCRFVFRDGKVIVADLKSTCGTYVNGRKITSPVVIDEAATVYVGDFQIKLAPR